MNLVLLVNPKSGRGLARKIGSQLRRAALERGHRCKALAVGGDEPLDPAKLGAADALIVVGGDGTVSHCAHAAIDADTPLYHAPTGNENLFARALGMTRHAPSVLKDLEALEPGAAPRADVGRAGDRLFLLMASAGPDAGVIHRVAQARTRAIGHLAYAAPILAEALRPRIPRVWCEVDGQPLVEGDRGVIIVCNTREYASRMDPARDAGLFTGQLHAVFLPAESTAGVLRWALPARTGRLGNLPNVPTAAGASVRVHLDPPDAPFQLDGEAIEPAPPPEAPGAYGENGNPHRAIDFRVEPACLPVTPGRSQTRSSTPLAPITEPSTAP